MHPTTGYLDPAYAASLDEFGSPRELPRCGGWILERRIPGCDASDAMGCYPIFACQSWRALEADLDDLAGDLVSLVMVADPFGDYDEELLRRAFPDLALSYKQHHVVDMRLPRERRVSDHHDRCARKALRKVAVEVCERPSELLDEWMKLHATLVERHAIQGIRALSPGAFAKQLALPGAVVVRAAENGEAVGAQIWLQHGEVAYGHVLATSPRGYEVGAGYALFATALDYFAERVRWCDLGAVPGASDAGSEGLREFKQGWSTGTRAAYLCGRIYDRDRYASLARAAGATNAQFFPAYRAGELTAGPAADARPCEASDVPHVL